MGCYRLLHSHYTVNHLHTKWRFALFEYYQVPAANTSPAVREVGAFKIPEQLFLNGNFVTWTNTRHLLKTKKKYSSDYRWFCNGSSWASICLDILLVNMMGCILLLSLWLHCRFIHNVWATSRSFIYIKVQFIDNSRILLVVEMDDNICRVCS